MADSFRSLHALTLQMPTPFMILSGTGSCLFANQAWSELCSSGDKILLSMNWLDFIHYDDQERLATLWEGSSATGVPPPIECRIVRSSGLTLWISLQSTPFVDPLNGVEYFSVTATELEVRKRMEHEVILWKQLFFSVLDYYPQMVFLKDAIDLTFIAINHAGEELLGISRDDFIGHSDADFFPSEQAEFFVSKDREVLMTKTITQIIEEPIDSPKLGKRYLRTTKIPICDETGLPRYLLGFSEDVTEGKARTNAHNKR